MDKLTDIQYRILRHVYDNKLKNHEPPTGITPHVYASELYELEKDGYVQVSWREGHDLENAENPVKLLAKGYAAVENMKMEKENQLESELIKYGLDLDSYKVLVNFNDSNEYQQFVDEMDQDDYDEICDLLVIIGYLTEGQTKDDAAYKVSRKGKILLSQLAMQLNDGDEQFTPVSKSEVYIKENCDTDVIKAIYGLCKLGMFVDSNGNAITDKKVMEALEVAFNAPSFKHYSQKLSSSKTKSNLNTFIQIGKGITEKLQTYFSES